MSPKEAAPGAGIAPLRGPGADGADDTGACIGGVTTSDDSGSEMAIVGAEPGPEGAAGIPRIAGPFPPGGGLAGSGDGMAAEGTGGGGIPAAGARSAGHARPPGDGDETAIVVSESESSCEYLTIVGAESGSSSSGD